MQPGTEKLYAKAARALTAAEAAMSAGAVDIAAGRAFYAILNAAKARLNEHGLRFNTHARIAVAYADLAALDGAPAAALDEALALRRRLVADGDDLSFDEASQLLAAARDFVGATLP